MVFMARHKYQWLWSCLLVGGLLLFVACADDHDDELQGGTLQLLSVTREGETTPTPEEIKSGSIRLFLATEDDYTSGSFSEAVDPGDPTNTIWTNNGASVKENTQYYFYGYMPNDIDVVWSGSMTKPAVGDYSDGATLTLSGMPVLTDKDICVIVGVKRVTDASKPVATKGEYGYLSGVADENRVSLLMGHLYSQLQLQFCVDREYYALRRIHLKAVTLKSTYNAKTATVTATVHLQAGDGLTKENVVFSNPATTRPDDDNAWKFDLLTGDDLNLVGAPEQNAVSPEYTKIDKTVNCPYKIFDSDGTYLTIESTYDVYDTNNNKIREGCKAVNKVKVSGMAPGVKKILTLTVTPTYLYVLSDPDLDNPTIHLN